MVFAKMSPKPSIQNGECNMSTEQNGLRKSKELGPKSLSKTFMKVGLKGMNWCWKLGKGKKAQNK